MLQNFAKAVFTLCLIVLVQSGGRARAEEPTNHYVDDKYDFSLTVPKSWTAAPLQAYKVPGVVRAAYAGTGGASIVVFIQEPGVAIESRFIVDQSAKSMEKNLGATVREKDVRSIAGKKAMWLVVEGNGTGAAIDGKGSVKTTQHWLAIPRLKDVIVVLMTCPSADFEENDKSFGEAFKTLVVGGSQSEAQQQSK